MAERNITDVVLNRVNELKDSGELVIPPTYSAVNALKSAYLILQETLDKSYKPVLETCTPISIINSLLNMVIQGLSPAKKQCYFVAYGNKLQLMRSYMGTIAVTKRLSNIKDIKAYCIYEGDKFKVKYNKENAVLEIGEYEPAFENIDIGKIKGAFAVIVGNEGILHTEIMTFTQIERAWLQGVGYSNPKNKVHDNFTEEMAKKTVINRACKMYANTSDDSDLLIGAFNETDRVITSEEIAKDTDKEIEKEISQNANIKSLEMPSQVDNTIFTQTKEKVAINIDEDKPNLAEFEEAIQVELDTPPF